MFTLPFLESTHQMQEPFARLVFHGIPTRYLIFIRLMMIDDHMEPSAMNFQLGISYGRPAQNPLTGCIVERLSGATACAILGSKESGQQNSRVSFLVGCDHSPNPLPNVFVLNIFENAIYFTQKCSILKQTHTGGDGTTCSLVFPAIHWFRHPFGWSIQPEGHDSVHIE